METQKASNDLECLDRQYVKNYNILCNIGSKRHTITCDVTGVLLHRNVDPPCTYVIAAKAKHQVYYLYILQDSW